MKKYFLLILLLCGCVHDARKERAHHAAEQYIKDFINPHGLETVSFSALQKLRRDTGLDSSLNAAHIDANDSDKVKKYVDSEHAQRPDRVLSNIRQADSIAKGRLFYYAFTYVFKVVLVGFLWLFWFLFVLVSVFFV